MMYTPFLWLGITIVLVIIELETFNLTTIWFALGGVAATILAIFIPDAFLLQFGLFLFVALATLLSLRNIVVKKLSPKEVKTNVHALIGRKVLVTDKIEEYQFGSVKVDGNLWTAKSFDGSTIKKDEEVEIIAVEGVKLIVKKVNGKE